MLEVILRLFGFTLAKNRKFNAEADSTSSEQILKSIDDFQNRPIYKKMTLEIIDKIPDSLLLQTIADNLFEELPKDYTKEHETILQFSKYRQAIFVIWQLEAEVNNGGFIQFYTNSSGRYADLIPSALGLVGAVQFSQLAERANDIYKNEYEQITKYQDGTIQGFSKSYNNNPLDSLDDEFYKLYLSEDLYKIQTDFIRNNKIEFVN